MSYTIEYYETTNLWVLPRTISTITVHATRSGKHLTPTQEYDSTVNHFQNPNSQASTEFVVGPGVVAVFVAKGQPHNFEAAWRYAHWHLGLGFTAQAKGTVGIEVVQSFPDDKFDPEVMDTVAELLAEISPSIDVPLIHIDPKADPLGRGVFGHEDVKLGNSDPGYQFDWDWALTGVQTPDYAAALQDMQDERDAYGTATGPTAVPVLGSPEDVVGEVLRRIEAAGRALLGEE